MSYQILTGRVEDILPTLADNSFDGVLCDPPYGLNTANTDRAIACLTRWLAGEPYKPTGGGFMSRDWDAWTPGPEVWSEVCRVIKPGAHCLAFGGTRMSDFLSIALRLGGLEIRDTVMWLYGSGFPKALSIGKALDKDAGELGVQSQGANYAGGDYAPRDKRYRSDYGYQYEPSTEAAAQWQHHYTALKPAHEPVIVAMKPIEGTYAENALAWGVAGINVDGCRVGIEDGDGCNFRTNKGQFNGGNFGSQGAVAKPYISEQHPIGRWPANVIHDGSDEVVAGFPVTSSEKRTKIIARNGKGTNGIYGDYGEQLHDTPSYPGGGSAARFFYCAKASKRERDAGCEGMEEREKATSNSYGDQSQYDCSDGAHRVGDRGTSQARNHHPTVKPLALTRYLATLILPPQRETPRRLLVPFLGSGSEAIGALQAGWDEVVGIELNPEYVAIAEARLAYWIQEAIQHPLFARQEALCLP